MALPPNSQFAAVKNRRNSVYLCEFTDGRVKVGFSNAPRRRLIGLSSGLAKIGVRICRFAVFVGADETFGYLRDLGGNEKRAIAALTKVATPIAGHREYFDSIPYETALATVRSALEH